MAAHADHLGDVRAGLAGDPRLPPFSGFWSKDAIIEAAFVGEGWRPWVFGTVTLLGAGITAFYMSRLFFMTFHGKRRWNNGHSWGGERDTGPVQHPHESPLLMTVPMVVLAVGSAALGGLLALGDGFTHLARAGHRPRRARGAGAAGPRRSSR